MDLSVKVTEQFAAFVVETRFESLPEAAVNAAKIAITDCLGCILAGSAEPAGRLVRETIAAWGGHPQASVLGTGDKTAAPLAALANGVMGHALDYDDVHWHLIWHPSVVLAPAALAMAEVTGCSGADFITAYLLGLEIGCRIGWGMTNTHYERGWHTTATLGSLGAAVVGAKLLKLDQAQTQQALGLAASMAGGLRQNFGTMTKPFHAGHAAQNGVTAATLAQKGFTADPNIIENTMGFCQVLCGQGEYDLAKMVQGLGQTYQILDPGIDIKPYPSCAGTHLALDAILDLRQENQITAGAAATTVTTIDCAVSYLIPGMLIYHRPTTPLQAKFSMEYCLAVALLDGCVGLDQFLPERVTEATVQQLLKQVHMRVHPDLRDAQGLKQHKDFAAVTLHLQNGQRLTRCVDTRLGSPGKPMSQKALLAKYRACAQGVLPDEHIEQSITYLSRLERLDRLEELVASLQPEPAILALGD